VKIAIVDLIQDKTDSYQQLLQKHPALKDQIFNFVPGDAWQGLELQPQNLSLEAFIVLVRDTFSKLCPYEKLQALDVIKLFPQVSWNELPVEIQTSILIHAIEKPADTLNFARISKVSQAIVNNSNTIWRKFDAEDKTDFKNKREARVREDNDCANELFKLTAHQNQNGIKVTFLGRSSSEKKLATKCLYEGKQSTVGLDFTFVTGHNNMKLQVWDMAGNEGFRVTTKFYFKNTRIFLIFPTSIEDVKEYCKNINQYSEMKKLIFIMQPNTENIKSLDFSSVKHLITDVLAWDQVKNGDELAEVVSKAIVKIVKNNISQIISSGRIEIIDPNNSNDQDTPSKCLVM